MSNAKDNSTDLNPESATGFSPGPSSSRSSSFALGALGSWLIPLPFGALVLAASILGHGETHWSLVDLCTVGAIDWLLFVGLHRTSLWLRSIHPSLSGLASAVMGLVVAFALEMDGGWLLGRKQLLFATASVFLVHQVLLRLFVSEPKRGHPARRFLLTGAASLVASAGLALFALQSLPSVRWHLFWHQHVIGLPLYSLLSTSIDGEQAALQASFGKPVRASDVVAAAEVPSLKLGDARGDVVFILVDTWRADSLAANGGARDLMPRLNALAEEGTVFTNLHANASWTRASCSTIFTGLLPEEAGTTSFSNTLPEAWTTLPEIFEGAGYLTAAFVTNWIQVGKKTGFGQGFDLFRELRSFDEVEERIEEGNTHIRELYARAEEVNTEVFAWLDDAEQVARRDQPLFLYVHYLDPHSPYLAGVEEGVAHAGIRARKLSGYRQEVRYTDEHIGVLVEGLRERLGPDVSFVITSDHGEEFWEHGAWGHGQSLYREQLWVPGIVLQGTGGESSLSRGIQVDQPIESRDLFDLTVALARESTIENNFDVGAWAKEHSREERYASQYLAQALDAPLPEQRKTVMRRLEKDGVAAIWSAYGPSQEIYDLGADPMEKVNLVGRDEERDEVLWKAMGSALRFWVHTDPVKRTQQELDVLNDMGYGGASAVTTVPQGHGSK